MDDIELRIIKLEEKAKLLTPNGFTERSFWKRLGTVIIYNLILGGITGIFWFLIVILLSVMSP
jgi:hypothetical protein